MDSSPSDALDSSRYRIKARLRRTGLPAFLDFIRREWHKGAPDADIAGVIGVLPQAIVLFALQQGFPPRTAAGPPRCLTAREVADLRVLWQGPASLQHIAATSQCDPFTLRCLALCQLWRVRKVVPSDLLPWEEALMRDMWGAGWAGPQIARLFGLSLLDFNRFVKKHGWPRRSSGKPACNQMDPQEAEAAQKLWESGTPVQLITARFGISSSALHGLAHKGGWTRRPKPRRRPPFRDRGAMKEMWDQKRPVTEIAEHFGVNAGFVYHLARSLSWPCRRRSLMRSPTP